MVTLTTTVDTVQFNAQSLICPLFMGEPYVIINHIANDIGLNIKAARRMLNKRFDRHLISVQFIEKYATEWWCSFEKNGQKHEFKVIQGTDSVAHFLQMKSYWFLALPIRKLAAWLYSIDIEKVKEEVKPLLERYQDECDEVLHEHFFGIAKQRKNLLIRKSEVAQKRSERENALLRENEEYQYLMSLKGEEMRIGKELKELDESVMNTQLSFFQ